MAGPGGRQKRYIDRLKQNNPEKFKAMQRRNAERAYIIKKRMKIPFYKYHVITKVPPKITTTEDQWKILLEYMEADPQFAVGIPSKASPKERYESHSRWAELANTLNNVECGYTRTEHGWRLNWNQEKFKARRKVAKIKKMIAEDRPKIPVITKIEERILTILKIPIPEVPVRGPPADKKQTCASPPDLPPPLGASSQQDYSLLHQVKIEIKEYNSLSDPELSRSPSPVVERRPQPTKLAGTRAPYQKGRPASLPPPEWVRNMEKRRLAVNEKKLQALQGIQANTELFANTLQGIHIGLVKMNQTLKHIQSALEATARAQQARLS